jgi:hypothetical protein
MPQGRAGVKQHLRGAPQRLADRWPAALIDTLREQFARLGQLDAQILDIERRLQWSHKRGYNLPTACGDPGCRIADGYRSDRHDGRCEGI